MPRPLHPQLLAGWLAIALLAEPAHAAGTLTVEQCKKAILNTKDESFNLEDSIKFMEEGKAMCRKGVFHKQDDCEVEYEHIVASLTLLRDDLGKACEAATAEANRTCLSAADCLTALHRLTSDTKGKFQALHKKIADVPDEMKTIRTYLVNELKNLVDHRDVAIVEMSGYTTENISGQLYKPKTDPVLDAANDPKVTSKVLREKISTVSGHVSEPMTNSLYSLANVVWTEQFMSRKARELQSTISELEAPAQRAADNVKGLGSIAPEAERGRPDSSISGSPGSTMGKGASIPDLSPMSALAASIANQRSGAMPREITSSSSPQAGFERRPAMAALPGDPAALPGDPAAPPKGSAAQLEDQAALEKKPSGLSAAEAIFQNSRTRNSESSSSATKTGKAMPRTAAGGTPGTPRDFEVTEWDPKGDTASNSASAAVPGAELAPAGGSLGFLSSESSPPASAGAITLSGPPSAGDLAALDAPLNAEAELAGAPMAAESPSLFSRIHSAHERSWKRGRLLKKEKI